jgi:hypothetical protein
MAEVKERAWEGQKLALPALHATQNVFFRHVWKMRLLSGLIYVRAYVYQMPHFVQSSDQQ